MMTLNFNHVLSNLSPSVVSKYSQDKQLIKRWKPVDDLRLLERRLDSLDGNMLCWKLSQKSGQRERTVLDVARQKTLTYVVYPEFPKVKDDALLRSLDSHVIANEAGLRRSLGNMALGLRAGAWELPVEVYYEEELGELMVTFANGDLVRWDVLKLGGYRWETAFADPENEPFAIGVFKKGVKEAVFFPAADVRRDTGTLPSKVEVRHELHEDDITRRAKNYGAFLKEKVAAKKLSQDQLAHLTGVSREQWNRILNGHHFPQISTLRKLAGALEVDVQELLR
jgi:DNA-binding XRE family transcriptional regulator